MAYDPQYTSTPNISADKQTTLNNVYDGTGTVGTIFTAGAAGSFLSFIRLKPLGTNIATLARFWINNGGSNATATNNFLYTEVALAATTASSASALSELTIPVNIALPAGYKINWALAVTVAAGWQATGVGGDY